MANGHGLLERLLQFDKKALPDLEQVAKVDPPLCVEIGWHFVTTVADAAPHVPAGFVDATLLEMRKVLGSSNLEDRVISSWANLSEETRGELCYSGIANPRVFSNGFCEQLFSLPIASKSDRQVILSSLASTLAERQFPKCRFAGMLDDLERKESDVESKRFIQHLRVSFL